MVSTPAFMVGAARPVVLTSGLSAVCGTRAVPTAAATAAPGRIAVTMTGSPGITLQTLLYEPNPTAVSVEDKDIMVARIYRQVFGNAYIMEEELDHVYKAQSMYRAGQIPVREFVRQCALSETYRRRFFSCCGPYRAVELNFKHLLGRGPTTQAEISEHVRRTIEEGYEADINSYIDSPEYIERFGDDYIPGITFKGTYTSSADFNNMCSMYSSPGTTDKSLTGRAREQGTANPNHVLSLDGAGIPSKLVALAAGYPASSTRVKRALPSRPDLDLGIDVNASLIKPAPAFVNENASPRKRVEITMGNYMFLTSKESAAYAKQSLEARAGASLARSEVAKAKAEIARLQARIATLSAVV
jgi:phycoerythrin-associated linker protein